jgi:lactoylglutathione lyase
MIERLDELAVITLFVEDLAACKQFYITVLGLEIVYEDAESAVVQMKNLMINLLVANEAPTLIEPAAVGQVTSGVRALYTINVEDAYATASELKRKGVAILNGPIDRPWGRRTAAFADPAGNVWEIAQVID